MFCCLQNETHINDEIMHTQYALYAHNFRIYFEIKNLFENLKVIVFLFLFFAYVSYREIIKKYTNMVLNNLCKLFEKNIPRQAILNTSESTILKLNYLH